MKKIFSLVCSLVLVLGANASSSVSQAALATKAPIAVEQVQLEPTQIANLDLNVTNTALEVMNVASVKKVAAADTIWSEWEDFAPFTFNTGKYAFGTLGTYTQSGVVVKTRSDNNGRRQYMFVNWGAGYFGKTGQNLIVNMSADSIYTVEPISITVGTTPIIITDAYTYTKSSKYAAYTGYDEEEGVFSLYNVVLIDQDTAVQYYTAALETLTMDKPITERDTVDVVSSLMNYNDSYLESKNLVIFYTNELEGYDVFRVTSNKATSVAGKFSFADTTINAANSYFALTGGSNTYFQDGEFTVKVAEEADTLTGWMIGTDEKYYRLNWTKKKKWDERDTVRVNAETLSSFYQGNPVFGYVYKSATDEYPVIQFVTKCSNEFGTFTIDSINPSYTYLQTASASYVTFQSGEITVSEDKEGKKLQGILIGNNEKAYVFNLIQPAGRLQYDTDAPFDANYAYHEMTASMEDGIITIYAGNDETAIGLELYADPAATTIPAGVFTIDTTSEAGTALQSVGVSGGYLTKCYAGTVDENGYIADCFFMVSGTITLSYDEYGKLNVEVDALNSYDQPVTATITYTKLTPKDTVEITDIDFFISDEYVASLGIYEYLVTDNILTRADLYVYADTMFGDFKENVELSYCKIISQSLSLVAVVDVEEFIVSATDKDMTLTAKLIGSDTILYSIVATGYMGAIQLDAKEAYEGNFAYESTTFVQATKTQVMINTVNLETLDTVALVVDAKLNKSGKLAAKEYKDIMASTGITAEYQVTPSFASSTSGAWFIQSGTLTVNEDESMVFVGLNSYDKTVTINFAKPQPVALKEVNAGEAVVKYFDGNKIVIRKGNKMFNILGAEL